MPSGRGHKGPAGVVPVGHDRAQLHGDNDGAFHDGAFVCEIWLFRATNWELLLFLLSRLDFASVEYVLSLVLGGVYCVLLLCTGTF